MIIAKEMDYVQLISVIAGIVSPNKNEATTQKIVHFLVLCNKRMVCLKELYIGPIPVCIDEIQNYIKYMGFMLYSVVANKNIMKFNNIRKK